MGAENPHWGPEYDWSYRLRAPKLEEVMVAIAASEDGLEPALDRAQLWVVAACPSALGPDPWAGGWRALGHALRVDALRLLVRACHQRQRTP